MQKGARAEEESVGTSLWTVATWGRGQLLPALTTMALTFTIRSGETLPFHLTCSLLNDLFNTKSSTSNLKVPLLEEVAETWGSQFCHSLLCVCILYVCMWRKQCRELWNIVPAVRLEPKKRCKKAQMWRTCNVWGLIEPINHHVLYYSLLLVCDPIPNVWTFFPI